MITPMPLQFFTHYLHNFAFYKMSHTLSVLLVLFVTSGLSLEPERWTHSLSLGRAGEVHLFWKSDKESVTFELGAKTHGYVGLGFSPNGGMAGADIVMGWIKEDGNITLQDYHGVGNIAPVPDDQQDYRLLGGYENETHTVLRFTRKLNTCDKHDMALGSDTLRLIWAYSEVDPRYGDLIWHGVTNRGVKGGVLLLHPPAPPIQQLLSGMNHWDVTVDNKFVSGERDTLYWCEIVKIPRITSKQHIVGFTPIIQPGNEAFIHHLVLYECIAPNSEEIFEKYVYGKGAECYTPDMPADWSNYCFGYLATWLVGSEGEIYPDTFGIPMGEKYGGANYLMFEMHYDNPTHNEFRDNSGVRLYHTGNLRRNDGFTIGLGQRPNPFQLIPPLQHQFRSYSYCPGECTSQTIPSEGIKIYSVLLHSHLAGKKIRLRHIRHGKEMPIIDQDNFYDFNYQIARVLPREITILPGDSFIVECEYDTSGRDDPTFGGTTSREEMCQAFVMTYPRIPLARCFSSPALETFFHGLGIRELNGFDIQTEGTDRLLQRSIDIMKQNSGRPKRTTIVNVDTDRFWETISISQPESVRNMSVGLFFQQKNWRDAKEMAKLEEYWEKGSYEVWCTLHGLTNIDLAKKVQEYPEFVPLSQENSSKCPFRVFYPRDGSEEKSGNSASLYDASLCLLLCSMLSSILQNLQ